MSEASIKFLALIEPGAEWMMFAGYVVVAPPEGPPYLIDKEGQKLKVEPPGLSDPVMAETMPGGSVMVAADGLRWLWSPETGWITDRQ